MSSPIIPPRDPSSHGIPPNRTNPLEPKDPGKFKQILEKDTESEAKTKDFLGVKMNPKEYKMVWTTMLQQMAAQIKIEQDRMMEELKRQQRQIENPDE